MNDPIVQEVIDVINDLEQKVQIEDLHIFRVGKGKYGCILALNSDDKIDINHIKKELSIHEELVHITVELKMK
jgi:Co/Zn/Cd efflux system component